MWCKRLNYPQLPKVDRQAHRVLTCKQNPFKREVGACLINYRQEIHSYELEALSTSQPCKPLRLRKCSSSRGMLM